MAEEDLTIEEIQKRYDADPENVELRERLATGLRNATSTMNADITSSFLQRIQEIYEIDTTNVEIRENLAFGLANSTRGTEGTTKESLQFRLKNFRKEWPEDSYWEEIDEFLEEQNQDEKS